MDKVWVLYVVQGDGYTFSCENVAAICKTEEKAMELQIELEKIYNPYSINYIEMKLDKLNDYFIPDLKLPI